MADECVDELRKIGYTETKIIGEVLEQSEKLEPITIKI